MDTPATLREYDHELALKLLTNTHLSMWEMLRRTAARYPDNDAVVMDSRRTSFLQLMRQALRCAAQLHGLGVEHGSHVAFLFHPCPEWIVLHYALSRLGAVAIPINLAYTPREMRFVLERTRPEFLISIDQFRGTNFTTHLREIDPLLRDGVVAINSLPSLRRTIILESGADERLVSGSKNYFLLYGTADHPGLEPLGSVSGDDAAYIVSTSGSTAFPKPALLPHRAFIGVGTVVGHALKMGPQDRFLSMFPTFHVSGVTNAIMLPHIVGAAIHLVGVFEPNAVLAEIEAGGCTATVAFDTMFTKMIGASDFGKRDINSLRKAVIASTPSYAERLQQLFQFDVVAFAYGCTESAAYCSITPNVETNKEIRLNTNGRPFPGVEFKIIDPQTGTECAPNTPGEICFRGWNRFIEYFGMPEETRQAIDGDGFFHSGDYGWLGEDGYVYYRGRYKMMVKTGGENVAEREVELFLESELASVEFSQVVGVPDETWGEAVVAFVQLVEGSAVTADELRGMCRGKIANFKIPKHFFLMTARDWPLLANGRPDKQTLRQIARDRLGIDSERPGTWRVVAS